MKLRSIAENTKLILLIAVSVLPLIPSTAIGTTKEQWNAAVATVEVLSAQKNVKTGMPQRALVIISEALLKSPRQNPFDERPTFVGHVKDGGKLKATDFIHPDSSVEQAADASEDNPPSKLSPREYAEQILRHLIDQPMFAGHEVLQTMLESLGTAPQKAGSSPKAPCTTSGTVPVIGSGVTALVRVGNQVGERVSSEPESEPAPDAGDSKRFPSDAKNEIVAVSQAPRGPRESKRVSLLNEYDLPSRLVGHSLTFVDFPSLANFAQTSKAGQAWFLNSAPSIEVATIGALGVPKLLKLQNSRLRVLTIAGCFQRGLDNVCTKFKDLRELNVCRVYGEMDTTVISKLTCLRRLKLGSAISVTFTLNSETLPELKSVNVSRRSWFGNSAIRQLKGFALEELKISGTQVSDYGLKELDVKALSGMTTLDLGGLEGITNGSVEVLNHLPALRHLNLRGTGMTDEGLWALDSKTLSQLRTLDLSGLPGVTDASIPKINEFTELTRLALFNDSFLLNNNLILNSETHYRDRDYEYDKLYDRIRITEEGLQLLDSKKLQKLEEITVPPNAVEGIDKLNEFPNLRVIVLQQVTDRQIMALDPDRLRMLESLEAQHFQNSPYYQFHLTDRSMPILERFHKLKKLNLSASRVTDQGLALLHPENHKALKELGLSWCRGITDASVPLILKLKAEGLKRVRISGSGITDVGRQAILNAGLEVDEVTTLKP